MSKCVNNVRASFYPSATHVFSRLTWYRPSADINNASIIQIFKILSGEQGLRLGVSWLVRTVIPHTTSA